MMTDEQIVRRIGAHLTAAEWSPDTLDEIAEVFILSGRAEGSGPSFMAEFLWAMAEGYLECAAWTATRYEGEEIAEEDLRSRDWEHPSKDHALEVCRRFYLASPALLDEAVGSGYSAPRGQYREPYTWAQAGHDLWLTRNGHGAGFWDRGLGAVGEALSDAARRLGEDSVEVDGNGCLYFEGAR